NQASTVTIQNVTTDYVSGNITVSYSISDVENNSVSLLFEYSKDGGASWLTGSPLEDLSNIQSGQYTGSFEWNYLNGLAGGIDYFVFRIRLTPFDFKEGMPDVTENLNVDLNEPPQAVLEDIYSPQSGDLSIQYHITDTENDTIRFVCSYSIDDGETWTETTHVSGADNIIAYDGTFVWHSKFDEPSIKTFTLEFRVVPWDHDEGTGDENEIFQLINNGPPDIEVSLPDTVSGRILIPFLITDPENDPVSAHVMWSHGDGKMRPATVIGDTLDIEQSAYEDTLEWDSRADAGEGYFQDLHLRVEVSDESNPPGSTVINFMDLLLTLDNEPPKFERVWGYAHSDTIYFNFNEAVIDSTVLKPKTYSLSHNLSVQTVQKGIKDVSQKDEDYQYFLLLDGGQTLPNDMITFSKTDVIDLFNNTAEEVSLIFSPDDDNENPEISILDLPAEVSGVAVVNYLISDVENDPVSLSVYYSTDGGHTWGIPSVLGDLTDISADNYSGFFIWKTLDDFPGAVISNVQLKVIPIDYQEGVPSYSNLFKVNNNFLPYISLSVADPDSLYSGTMEFFYELNDSESDTLSISALYSLDNGETYSQATVGGMPDNITSENYKGTLLWNTIADLPDSFRVVIFKVVPFDKREGIPDSLSVMVDNYGISHIAVTLPEGEQTGETTVTYLITDPKNRNVSLTVEYSTDNQITWHSADIEGMLSPLAPENYQGSFIWKSDVQLNGYEGIAYIRITPDNGKEELGDIDEVYLDYNVPPVITVEPVAGEVSGDVSFQYSASDTEQDKVSISMYYSIDDRKNWLEAETSGDKSDVIADGSNYSIIWHTAQDLPGKDFENVRVKLTASDFDAGNTVEPDAIHIDNNVPPSVELAVENPYTIHVDFVDVDYTLIDSENDVLAYEVVYSTDGGTTYNIPTVTGETANISSSEYSSTFRWEIVKDLPESVGEAIIKLIPSDMEAGYPDSLEIRYNTFGVCEVALVVPKEEQSGEITISYEISDEKNRNVSLNIEYSTNKGETWNTASIEGDVTNIAPSGYKGSFVWKTVSDLQGIDAFIWLKITPDNGAEGAPKISEIAVDNNDPPFIEYISMDSEKKYSGWMTASFKASDAENDTMVVNLEYSLDDGTTYHDATVSSNPAVIPDTDADITWSLFEDVGYVSDRKVYLRLTPYDKDPGEPFVKGPYTVTNIVGDYNFDLKIDGDDLPYFIDAWNKQDISKEIGPASGTPPLLSVQPDSKVDFEDLSVFIWVWNWYSEQVSEKAVTVSRPALKNVSQTSSTANIRIIPSGDGTFSVECDSRLDYMCLLIEPDEKDKKIEITLIDDVYWTKEKHGISLTRSYGGRMFEIAAALPENSGRETFATYQLGRLDVENDVGDIHFMYKIRVLGEKEIIEGETLISKDDLFKGPSEFALRQNIPNPFNPSTTIEYVLSQDSRVTLTVLNIAGQKVAELKDELQSAGYHSVRWDAVGMPSGIYFYTLKAGKYSKTNKMLLLK
ncbi:MAG: T9SS type A sorting domain-containing protein, partial [Candidatus Latescibacteria bacterium]|nr:T9SS type A sorting domain-containing protein [Candidatus Latescibacterota bacterium]